MEFEKIQMPKTPDYCPQCNRATLGAVPFCQCNFDLRHGNPHRPKVGVCIYCSDKGRIVLTAEHIFGKWLIARFPKSPTARTSHKLTRPEVLDFGVKPVMHERTYDKRGHQYFRTIHNVCEECNTGWMSGVHSRAMELVARLAGGEWCDFNNDDQLALARWATMVAINLECQSRQHITTQSQRNSLKQGGMPVGWQIAICRMKGSRSAGYSHLRKKVVDGIYGEEHLIVQSVFFCIEGVAFHALSSFGALALLLGGGNVHGGDPVFNERKVWPTLEPRKVGRRIYYMQDDIVRLQDRFRAI
jgi:hypothetical protein